MGIKTIPHPSYSPDLASCDFWLFPKLRGCRYETIEEMKAAVTKVIDTLTQEDFHEAFQKLLEWYKCIAAGGDYFEGDSSFMRVLSIKVPIRNKSGNLFNDPHTVKNDKTSELMDTPFETASVQTTIFLNLFIFWKSVVHYRTIVMNKVQENYGWT